MPRTSSAPISRKRGDEDVVRKVLGDLTSAGVEIDESAIRQALEHKTVEARRHFIEAQG